MIEASIVIPTFRRGDLLRAAIDSCLAQQGVAGKYEIIVVDNNPDGSARPVVRELAARGTAPIRYVAETRPGISHARNAGIAAATRRYVAFLDDDETAEPGWLAAHLDAIRRFEADIVVGCVRPRFPPDAAPQRTYPADRFTREFKLPTGTPVPRLTGIGNTLIDRERCIAEPEPFDPRFGLIGGEDTLFMRRQLRHGRRIVWCAEARVDEAVPADRLQPRFLLRRAFVRGQVTSFVCASMQPPMPGTVARMMAAGVAQALLFGVPALLLRGVNDPRWLPLMDKACLGLGKVFWHPRLQRAFYR